MVGVFDLTPATFEYPCAPRIESASPAAYRVFWCYVIGGTASDRLLEEAIAMIEMGIRTMTQEARLLIGL